MLTDTKTSNIFKDLENIYLLAIEKGNFTAALKAKELLGRSHGLFSATSLKKNLSLESLSDEELDSFIQEVERKIKEEGG